MTVLLPRIASHLWKPVQGFLFPMKSSLNINTHSSFSSLEYDMSFGQCHSSGSPQRQLILSYIVNSCITYFCVYLAFQLDCNFLEGRGHLFYFLKWPTGHNAILGDKIGTGHWQKSTDVSLRRLILRREHSLWVMIFYTYVPNIIVLKVKLTFHVTPRYSGITNCLWNFWIPY